MEISMKLTEYKTKHEHYFRDKDFKLQNEYKSYYNNNQLRTHCYFKDGERHGEYKIYNPDGSLDSKSYYSNGKNITDMYNKLKKWKSL